MGRSETDSAGEDNNHLTCSSTAGSFRNVKKEERRNRSFGEENEKGKNGGRLRKMIQSPWQDFMKKNMLYFIKMGTCVCDFINSFLNGRSLDMDLILLNH